MASVAFLQGRHKILDRTIDWVADTIKVILMKSAWSPTVTDDGIPTANEISGVSGYTGGFAGAGRKSLASKAINRDNGNTRVELDAADPSTWTALGTGDTIGWVLVAKEVTNDGLSLIITADDVNNTPTNGGDITYVINAEGLQWM